MAALLLLERLSPLERAVFVLREVFRVRLSRDRRGGGALGARLPPARSVGPASYGRRAATVRGRVLGTRGDWRHGSSVLSGTVTSRACGNCWPPTSS